MPALCDTRSTQRASASDKLFHNKDTKDRIHRPSTSLRPIRPCVAATFCSIRGLNLTSELTMNDLVPYLLIAIGILVCLALWGSVCHALRLPPPTLRARSTGDRRKAPGPAKGMGRSACLHPRQGRSCGRSAQRPAPHAAGELSSLTRLRDRVHRRLHTKCDGANDFIDHSNRARRRHSRLHCAIIIALGRDRLHPPRIRVNRS